MIWTSCHLSRDSSNSEVFINVWFFLASSSMNSQCYQKNECSNLNKGKQDLTCITLTPQGLFRYSKMMGFSLSVSRTYLVKIMVSDAHVHQTKNLFPKLVQRL